MHGAGEMGTRHFIMVQMGSSGPSWSHSLVGNGVHKLMSVCRPHHVGMPVAPLFNATAQQLAEVAAWEPPSEYKVFASFKGRFSTNSVRPVLGRLHDPTQGIIIVNSELGQPPDVNWTTLMGASAFALVPRGDARWSYRFTEAVCSGSVPVVVGVDGWLMPLDRLAPFDTYGIFISVADASSIIELLRAIPEQERLQKAAAAREVCQRWLGSPQRIAQAVLTELTMKLLAASYSVAGMAGSMTLANDNDTRQHPR